MRYRLALLLAVLSGTAAAQRQGPTARGAASIVATDVQRRIGIIADDSMLGRATPSPQLDAVAAYVAGELDRKSTRLNSSHGYISYAVFCLKKKKENILILATSHTHNL